MQSRQSARTSAGAELEDAFLDAFRHHPAGVAIITGDLGEGPVAITVSSLISVSRAPPTVAFSLSETSTSARAVGRSDTVVIHLIEYRDIALAQLCATSAKDKFGPKVAWQRLKTGEPYYSQVRLRFRAAIRDRLELSGAKLVTAEILETYPASERIDKEAIIYANRRWHKLNIDAAANEWWPEDLVTF